MVEKLKQDMIEAMKAKDKERLTTIRMIKGELDKEHIDKKREINDELLIEVVTRGIKQRKDSISEFEKGNRSDLIEKTQSEIDILQNYLPEQLSEDEVITIIDEAISLIHPGGVRDMGKVMKAAKEKIGAASDGRTINEAVKKLLA